MEGACEGTLFLKQATDVWSMGMVILQAIARLDLCPTEPDVSDVTRCLH